MNFKDLELNEKTIKAISEANYETPTPIQEQAIPVILSGRDVMGIAQTGTGKTASFTLPMIEILSKGQAKARMPRSLILSPTRELAMQIAENFDIYGKYHKLSKALLIGGESVIDQEKLLDQGVDVLIATPGRLLDLFDRGRILLSDIKIFVIDEADRMLDMGFIPDIEKIAKLMPFTRQTLLFSATMAKEIETLANTYLLSPVDIRIAPKSCAADTVTQRLVYASDRTKRKALRFLLHNEEIENAMIFCNRKKDVDIMERSLKRHGFNAIALHGDMTQDYRTEALEEFKKGDINILVCSDVAARGLDIQAVSHVFNYDVPSNPEDYIHRIGRTGRAGAKGMALTISTKYDHRNLMAIFDLLGNEIEKYEGQDNPKKPAKEHLEEKEDSSNKKAEKEIETKEKNYKEGYKPKKYNSYNNNYDDKKQQISANDIGEMNHDDNVIAFGEHTPAFMLNSVIPNKVKKYRSKRKAN